MVNPAESVNNGMLAVGAAHWSTPSAIQTTSSRAPLPKSVYTKPDIVGADGVGTHGVIVGTSFSAPHVAGLAALFRQRFPSYSAELVAYFLKSNASPRGTPPDPNNTWGHGFAHLPHPNLTPGQPSGFSGTGNDESITLTWNDASNATGFVVEQWDRWAVEWKELPYTENGNDGPWTYDYKLSGAKAVIGNLVNGVTYYHQVKSTNGSRASKRVGYINTRPASSLAAPTRFRGTGGNRTISLDWSDVTDATTYQVQQWDGSAGQWRFLRGSAITFSGSSATVNGLNNGAIYFHRVRATNSSTNSAWADHISTRLPSRTKGGPDLGGPPPRQPVAPPTPTPTETSPGS